MEMTENDVLVTARTLLGEAEPGNLDDACAIAAVIVNRAEFRNWPDTAREVCLQPWQFSCWNVGDPNRERIMHAMPGSSPWFDRLMEIAREAPTTQVGARVKKCTHYVGSWVKEPKWARGKSPVLVVKHRKGTAHSFYNDIDTPPPTNATEALDQIKPIAESSTIQGGVVQAGASVAGAAALIPQILDAVDSPWAQGALIATLCVVILVGLYMTVSGRLRLRKRGQA